MDINRHLQRKFLIVVDGTPESHAALRFAARRAHGTGGKVALLLVIEPETHDHWLGVSTLMKEEAEIEAEKSSPNRRHWLKCWAAKNPKAIFATVNWLKRLPG